MAFDIKKYLLNKPEAVEDFPFGPEVAAYKVRNKIFALIGMENNEARINLKCDPAEAEQLRMVFDAVLPGYHMNKKHWNTLRLNNTVPEQEIKRQIDQSRFLVIQSLPKVQRQTLLAE